MNAALQHVGDYEARIDYDLLGGEWVVRVRYVAAQTFGGRNQYATFVLVPDSQVAPFDEVCRSIEHAVEAHRHRGGTLEVSR